MVSIGATAGNNPLLQVVTSSTGSLVTLTTTMTIDDTVPTNTTGTEVITATITPKSSSNILYILFTGITGVNASTTTVTALFQDSTTNALASSQTTGVSTNNEAPILIYKMTAGTTSATTFKVRMGPQTSLGPIYLNGSNVGTALWGGVASTKLTVYEYQA